MGLRVNTGSVSQYILRQLRLTDAQQSTSLERLSTGLRLNRSSDDPSGMAVADRLRVQTEAMRQAVSNSTNAENLVSTAEAALNEVNTLLTDIRASLIFALNTGGSSPDQVTAEQDAVDNALKAIDKIAHTTRFGSVPLLDGSGGFKINTQFPTSGLAAVTALSLLPNAAASSTTFTVDVLSQAQQAMVGLGAAANTVVASGGPITLRVQGPAGVQIFELAAGSTRTDLEDAINSLRGNIGVYTSGGVAYTEAFGRRATIVIDQIGGGGTYTQAQGIQQGVDAVATVNGIVAAADGNTLHLNHRSFTGDIELRSAPEGGAAGRHTFEIQNNSGLQFQLDGYVSQLTRQVLGMPDMSTAKIGSVVHTLGGLAFGGVLESLQTGGANDLFKVAGLTDRGTTLDPVSMNLVPFRQGNAVEIVDAAIDMVSTVRGFFGAFVSQTAQPNIRSLETGIQDLTQSESQLRDVDFAQETAALTRAQVLFQAGISVLGQANVSAQTALQLLGG